jgi:predicted transcriptional regulator
MTRARSMGNNMSKMGECLHNIRKSAKLKIKTITKEQSELESRINECKKSLATINEFKEKNEIPQAVLQAILRGQDELEEEHYMLASEIFDYSSQMAEALIQVMELAKICKCPNCS